MKVFNVIDEKGRMASLPKYEINIVSYQLESHTISYLGARELLKECFIEPFGLEKLMENENE